VTGEQAQEVQSQMLGWSRLEANVLEEQSWKEQMEKEQMEKEQMLKAQKEPRLEE